MPSRTTSESGATDRLAPAQIRRIIIGLMMAILLAALDQTIVATALPTIGRVLGDVDHLPWVVTAYLLAATSAVPIYGKLSDIHGRRPMLLVAIATFVAGSVVCAMAPTLPVLIGARFLQGAGGGGLLALSQTIIGDMLTPRERAGYQVYISSAFMGASLAGPVAGGFFAQHLSWTMIFWINVPLGFAAFLMTSAPLKNLPRHERKHRLDVLGAALLVAATSTLLLGLSWAGARFGWGARETLAIFGLSALLIAAFSFHVRHTTDPLIPLEILANTVVRDATIAATLSVGLSVGLAIYAPILFESVYGLTASQSGLALIPFMSGTVVGALVSGQVMARFRHYKRLPLALLPVAIIVSLVLMNGAGSLPTWALSTLLAVVSISLGTLLPVSTVSIQNAVAVHQLGTATSTANLCRQLGGAVAVAAFGAIVLGTDARDVVTTSVGGREALLGAFRIVFAIVSAGSVMALVTMIRMEERPLAGPSRKTESATLARSGSGREA